MESRRLMRIRHAVQPGTLSAVERKLNGLINALADGFRAPGLQGQLDPLETKRTAPQAALQAPAPALPRLHPNLVRVYRSKVERLPEALQAGADGQEALDALRNLIEHIVLVPLPYGRGFEIELIGEIAAMVRLGMEQQPAVNRIAKSGGRDLFERSAKLVAGIGFEPMTFRL